MALTVPGWLALRAARRRQLWQLLGGALLCRANCRSHAPFVWGMIGGILAFAADPDLVAGLPAALVLFACLALIGLFDARYFIIPDIQVIALAVLGLLQALETDLWQIPVRLLAGAAGYALLRAVSEVYRHWRGFDGMGRGDAKLLAAGGMWIGLAGLPACLLWASLSGLLAALILSGGKTRIGAQTAIPFGPHLCLGIWLVWVFGPLLP